MEKYITAFRMKFFVKWTWAKHFIYYLKVQKKNKERRRTGKESVVLNFKINRKFHFPKNGVKCHLCVTFPQSISILLIYNRAEITLIIYHCVRVETKHGTHWKRRMNVHFVDNKASRKKNVFFFFSIFHRKALRWIKWKCF